MYVCGDSDCDGWWFVVLHKHTHTHKNCPKEKRLGPNSGVHGVCVNCAGIKVAIKNH